MGRLGPVVAVLGRVCEADESILAPLGRAALHAVTPANQALLGVLQWCHDLDDGTQ